MWGRWSPVAVAVAVVMAVAVTEVAAQARPPRCPARAAACRLDWHGSSVYEFTVQGKYFGIEYVDGKRISVRCGEGGPSLESGSLPAFETELSVEAVAVEGCGVAQYEGVFRALNVSVASRFDLTVGGTGAAPLAAAHLARLGGVRALTLRHARAPLAPLLAHLPDLVELTVMSTTLPPGELDAPPRHLRRVYLTDAGVTRVPAALLALPDLRALTVLGKGSVRVEREEESVSLRSLVVSGADEALLAEWAPPALEVVHLSRWAAPAPAPLPACASLATLTLVEPAARRLPPGWVARCPRLAALEVRSAAHLTSLPPGLLANASSLTLLVLRSCSLSSLPPDLFDGTPRLAHLDLSGNRLKELPSGALVQVSSSLLELDLSNNELTSQVGGALVALLHLRNLSLANNRRLGDLCKSDEDAYITVIKNKSPLASMTRLQTLNLKNTAVTVVCSDWRLDLQLLADLDLRGTRVSSLAYEDLKYVRRVRASVRLQDTPLHDVLLTAGDYAEARAGRPPNVTVSLGGAGTVLACDCYLYWFARALEDGLLPVAPEAGRALRCAGGGGALGDVRPEELACEAPAGACPAPLPRGCTCGVGGGVRAALRVRCERAGLARVPRVPAPPPDLAALDLLLAGNSIAALTRDDVPPFLRTLDLRNNSIERIEEATAVALVGRGEVRDRRVQLAGNPLDCSCRLAGARRVLRAGRALLDGYRDALRCRDGRLLADVSDAECAPTALAASLAGLAAAAALVGAALGARQAGALRRLKALLRRLGWAPSPRADPARPYDAFVTFGRGDEAAALEVTARLERGPRVRRVLLQERDWLPPAWVPHCVEASVGAARRTVALVSPQWERWLENAEVRAAYEGAWRGALVLLLPPAPAPGVTDSALRRYARDYPHLVLRRGRRGFWRGLERALPPPPPAPDPPDTRPHV